MRLDPPFNVITPRGKAEAHFLWHSGPDGTEWGCIERDGIFLRWPNSLVRFEESMSNKRFSIAPIKMTPELVGWLEMINKRIG